MGWGSVSSKDITQGAQSFNRFNKDIVIHVKTHDSKKDMQRARADHDGSNVRDHRTLLGFTIFSNSNEDYVSTIHIPVNCSEKTLGHELLHCLKGTFHKEKN